MKPTLLGWMAVAAAVALLVVGQYWLKRSQEQGLLGRTPLEAVLFPLLLWLAGDVAAGVLLVRAAIRRSRTAIGLGVILILCIVGTVMAYNALAGLTQVT